MYVMSIIDRGEARNFLASAIAFAGSHLNATINGAHRMFELGQLIDIETVGSSTDGNALPRSDAF